MSARKKATPAPTVERGEGRVESYLYVTVSESATFDAEITIEGTEGCCVKVQSARRTGDVADSEVLLEIRTLRNDEWRAFVALMQSVFAERERLEPAVRLLNAGVSA